MFFCNDWKNDLGQVTLPQEQTGKGASLRAARATAGFGTVSSKGRCFPNWRAACKPGRLKRKCLLVGLEDGSPRACYVAKNRKALWIQRSMGPFFYGNVGALGGLLPGILENRGFMGLAGAGKPP
jgi:hypothetical protein